MSDDFYNNITIKMIPDEHSTAPGKELIEKSFFFRFAYPLNLNEVIAPAENHLNTEKLGELWRDIKPKNDEFTFEIAAVLPYFLPQFDGDPDYSVELGGSELVVSSRMVRCFFTSEADENDQLQYYLVHQSALKGLVEQKKLLHIHPISLRSFIAKRFTQKGDNIQDLIQNNFNSWIRSFMNDLSHLLDAIRTVSPTGARQILPQMATTSLPTFWLAVEGGDKKFAMAQFVAELRMAANRPLFNLDQDEVKRVQDLLSKETIIPIHESSLALARTYLFYGYLGLAIVQVCVACESKLSQAYQSFLYSRGVSKNRYEEASSDITFSQLLNIHLAAAYDLSKLSGRQDVLGTINWARKRRNQVAHEGETNLIVTPKEVEKAIQAAESLIDFLINYDVVTY